MKWIKMALHEIKWNEMTNYGWSGIKNMAIWV